MSQDKVSQILALRVLTLLAGTVNASLDKFSGWLMVGTGGAFSLLLTNIEKLVGFVNAGSIRFALSLMLVSLAVGVIAKFLSAMISASVASNDAAFAVGKDAVKDGFTIDIEAYLIEFKRGLFFVQRLVAETSFKKLRAGDLAAGGRLVAKLSQVNVWIVLFQAILILWSAVEILVGVKI
ncbi:hypothetical protein RGU75_13495 [Glaciimonas sp. CA11.2]|uniref:hypothetical protein n=1 Tax=Glaciimonas sp. CA11.2 TaxID=3048601 RepID=UPI002AB3C295|nr:hypothetical protein [Glaciimonas sp. CA11.2]MDY7547242.1 hypothetical protein [Glaciimonas sp. CA11.2]